MELSEVVNPHFAFPVVGVVVCAFLVFAFGFKSSVQPPSFDFDNADDGKRKKTKTKKKPHSNAQVTSTDGAISVVVKPTVGVKQTPASKNVPVVDKNQKAQKEAKTKVKKVTVKSSNITSEIKQDRLENDGSGWETVSLPKKKKNKGRKDGDQTQGNTDGVSGDDQPRPAVSPQIPQESAQVAVVDELPRQQRDKRERDRPGKTHIKETVSEVDVTSKENTAEQKTIQDNSNSHFEVVGTKDKKKDSSSGTSDIAKPNQKKAPASTKPKQTKTVIPDGAKPSTQNEAQVSSEVNITPVQSKSGNAPTAAPAAESKPSTAAPAAESKPSTAVQSTQAEKLTRSPDGSKDSKSPKKKKEKMKKDVAPPAIVESSPTSPVSVSASVQATGEVSSSAQEVVSRESTVVLPTTGADKSTTADTATAAKGSSTITFDEMGDWQEAKTIKKRKPKARRDN